MIASRGFVCISMADFIVRSAYQMGKTPVLPIFAASLGAGEAFLGFIVSVSTLTGMLLKPFFGFLSDRWGRRVWLLVGTGLFAGIPFLYGHVDSPGQLFSIRIIHGTASAIYGPVTLAYVAELSGIGRAERLGWFSVARGSGYVIGPAAGGIMLQFIDVELIFTIIGIVSCIAFLPVFLLPEYRIESRADQIPIIRQLTMAFRYVAVQPSIWLASALNGNILFSLYAAKAFLPMYALSVGLGPATVGLFFAAQEIIHICLNPICGRLADRFGHLYSVGIGVAIMGIALSLLTLMYSVPVLFLPAFLIGFAQALVFPSTLAMVSLKIDDANLGAGMGVLGTMKNVGKVAGPITVGLVLYWLDFETVFRSMGVLLIVGAVLMWVGVYHARRAFTQEGVKVV